MVCRRWKKRIGDVDSGKDSRYFAGMVESTGDNPANEPSGHKQETIAGFLASALDMEDEISNSVYRDYMKRENWPAGLKPDVFEEIKKHLTTLIEDTERHRKTILGLIKQHGKDDHQG